MERKEILENIRKQFKQLFSSSYETMPVSTADGKNFLIMGEGLEIGYQIVEVGEDNIQTPVADGEYNLSDGTKIGIVGGLINAIMAPEAPKGEESPIEVATVEMEEMPMEEKPEEKPEGPDSAGQSPDTSSMEKRVADLEAQLQEVMKMLSDTMGSCGTLKDKQMEMSSQLKKISEEPSGTSITVKKMVQNTESRKVMVLDEIRDIQKKMNKG